MNLFQKLKDLLKYKPKHETHCDECGKTIFFNRYSELNMNGMGATFCDDKCKRLWHKDYKSIRALQKQGA